MNDNDRNAPPKPPRLPPWNKDKLIGPKPPLKVSHIWSIRTKMKTDGRVRDLALFNLAIDSKLRGCDLVALRVDDVAPHGRAADRATVRQTKTGRTVRFEMTEQTREAVDAYLRRAGRSAGQCLFPGRRGPGEHLTTRQYARLVGEWVASIGLDPLSFGTHSMRRTKATLIYRRTGNLRAVQLLFGTATYYPRTPYRTSCHLPVPRHASTKIRWSCACAARRSSIRSRRLRCRWVPRIFCARRCRRSLPKWR